MFAAVLSLRTKTRKQPRGFLAQAGYTLEHIHTVGSYVVARMNGANASHGWIPKVMLKSTVLTPRLPWSKAGKTKQ